MVMDWRNAALVAAGIIGCGVAILHGVLIQRLMIRPVRQLGSPPFDATIKRLFAGLLHFTTYNWFLSGLALLGAVFWLGEEGKLVTGLLVGSSYLFGALGNLWATRRPHPGWILYGAAVLLIVYGLRPSAG
jgi:hypothetical protein